jgi:hypothetical protein
MAAIPQVSSLTGRRKTLVAEARRQLDAIPDSALTLKQDFYAFELGLPPLPRRLARLLLELFCASRELAFRGTLPAGRYNWVSRSVLTIFGEPPFSRVCVWAPDDGGYCPLDRELA